MKRMRGFWATIVTASITAIGMTAIAYLSPVKSTVGYCFVLVILFACVTAVTYVINFLYKDKENPDKEKYKDAICASSKAIERLHALRYEFAMLISEIAWHNAESDGKPRPHLLKEGEFGEKALLSPEDMEAAFLEAAKLVSERCGPSRCSCKTDCDKQTMLDRIRTLRKRYEKK